MTKFALLVSHWPVNSDAAVKLTTKTFSELKSHPEIGRAEALRRSMVELIHHGPAEDAHPAMWGALRACWRGRRGSLISSNAGHSFSTGGTCSLKEASYSPRLAHRRLEEIGRSNAIAPAWRLPTRISSLVVAGPSR
jgi:CHAT domain